MIGMEPPEKFSTSIPMMSRISPSENTFLLPNFLTSMAMKNIDSAEENLRCANLGFKEGVMEVTDVMAAQTA